MGVTRFTELVRAAHFRKRQDAIDHRRELARVDDLRDLGQLSTARVAGHKCGADAERFRLSQPMEAAPAKAEHRPFSIPTRNAPAFRRR